MPRNEKEWRRGLRKLRSATCDLSTHWLRHIDSYSAFAFSHTSLRSVFLDQFQLHCSTFHVSRRDQIVAVMGNPDRRHGRRKKRRFSGNQFSKSQEEVLKILKLTTRLTFRFQTRTTLPLWRSNRTPLLRMLL